MAWEKLPIILRPRLAVQPDLIHCHDWMTGLIPAMARQVGIPCLFTVHNIHTVKSTLAAIEDRGIDTAEFWQNLYFEWMPGSYEEIRDYCPVDFLASGIFTAHFVNTVSPTFLREVIQGQHTIIPAHIRQELANKASAECALGVINAPDPSFNPFRDSYLEFRYGPHTHAIGKKANKHILQKRLGLVQDDEAPLFFWPSRLDPMQKGCQLLAEILYELVSSYWSKHLQIVFVADGKFKQIFRNIVDLHDFFNVPSQVKRGRIGRIMQQSNEIFNHAVTARQYITLYEKMLQRPLVDPIRQMSVSLKRHDIAKTVSTALENFTRRRYDFIRGRIHRIGLASDRQKIRQKRRFYNAGSGR